MSSQQIPLLDITKRFNPSTNTNLIENIKMRSKSTQLLKPKLYHQSSIDNIKTYDKTVLTDSKQSLPHNASFERKYQHQISTEIVIKEEDEERNLNSFDVFRVKIGREASGEQNQKNLSTQCQPSQNPFSSFRQSIKDFSFNENHLISLDSKGKVAFSSLDGEQNKPISNFINEFFKSKNITISNVFSFSYSIFFLEKTGKVYSLGLNNKGQLGHNTLGIINKPELVCLPLKSNENSSKVEKIVNIVGGPFHSVLFTNFNNVYYAGALYSQKEILNESFISKFTELSIKNQSIKQVECGLTSCVFLTKSNKIYIMGLFGNNNFYTSPTDIEFPIKSNIKQIKVSNDCIYLINQNGILFKINMNKKIPIISENKLQDFLSNKNLIRKTSKCEVVSIHSSFDKIVFVAKFQQKSVSQSSYRYFIEGQVNFAQNLRDFQEIEVSVKYIKPQKVIVDKSFFYFIFRSGKKVRRQLENIKIENETRFLKIQTYLDKIKALQQENQKLKHQNDFESKQRKSKLKQQNKSPVSNINFNFQQQINPRTFVHDLEIQFSDIKLTKKIAEGGYGVIYKGEWKKTVVAVKIFKIDENNTNSIKEFISECRAMEALRHPNIVMFLGACLKPPNFAIVLQYCEGGTLWSLLQTHKIDLAWRDRITLALEVAKAMNYLHDRKNPIVHRDLKSLNILLDNNRRVKLADFGWTKCLENYMTSKIGTYQWMAPEVLTGQQYSEKADVFSYSIILWEISARQPPYRSNNFLTSDINGIQVAYDVANKEFRPTIPKETPVSFKELTEMCWQKVPQRRPSFVEIIENLEKQLVCSS